VPLRRLLPLSAIAGNGAEFSAGPGPRVLTLPGLPPVSPLICYEIIFPGRVKPPAGAGAAPRWIVNITNDGWYGRTAGPHQHFDMARARAVEEGLPVVRVANTGISGTIDPLGRVIAALPLGTEGVVDSVLPEPVALTLYGRLGDLPYAFLLAATLACGFLTGRKGRPEATI
jgi:apolipoprotein N-acyltransferase